MKNTEIKQLVSAFEEASSITLTLVALPVLLLFLGLVLDKTFSTTPLFIIASIVVGVPLGLWRAQAMGKKYKIHKIRKKLK